MRAPVAMETCPIRSLFQPWPSCSLPIGHVGQCVFDGPPAFEPKPDLLDEIEGFPRLEIPPEPASPSESDEWSTPLDFFQMLDGMFGPFTIDATASDLNHRVATYLTKQHDTPTLHVHSSHVVWMNPPYSRGNLARFMRWALREVAGDGAHTVCCLVPAHTCEKWFQRNVLHPDPALVGVPHGTAWDNEFFWQYFAKVGIGLHFPAGRLRFVEAGGKTGAARFSSAVVVYQRPE